MNFARCSGSRLVFPWLVRWVPVVEDLVWWLDDEEWVGECEPDAEWWPELLLYEEWLDPPEWLEECEEWPPPRLPAAPSPGSARAAARTSARMLRFTRPSLPR